MKFSLGLLFILSLSACQKEEVDTIPPGLVTDLVAMASNGQVVLSWTEPNDQDLHQIEVAHTPGSGVTLTQAAGLNGMTVSGLDNDTEYEFAVVTVDETGNKSDAVLVNAVPNPPFQVISPNQDNYNPVGGTFTTDGSGHLVITINFNRAVDPGTVAPSQTIYFEGDIKTSGTVEYSNQNRTLTFTTAEVAGDLGSFSPNLHFDFFLIGEGAEGHVITDSNGMVLDGDEDGEAGGNYELNLYIIG